MFLKAWHEGRLTVRWVPEEEPATEGLFPDEARILTAAGPAPVGRIAPGDRIWRRGGRPLPVLGIERRVLRPEPLGDPRGWPVRLAQEALGRALPLRALVLSPGQRVVPAGGASTPVAAVALVDGCRILQRPPERPVPVTRLLLAEAALVQVESLLVMAARRPVLLTSDPLSEGRPRGTRRTSASG
ncbi:Hint domain-containing protein [Cereibacter sphaeroides f. sp. denitrificans]|nr:hypothetical protein DWF04_06910 [Cereibacter sphaeroides f. sp. denitrificans]